MPRNVPKAYGLSHWPEDDSFSGTAWLCSTTFLRYGGLSLFISIDGRPNTGKTADEPGYPPSTVASTAAG